MKLNSGFLVQYRTRIITENIGAGLDRAVGDHQIGGCTFVATITRFDRFGCHHIADGLPTLLVGVSLPYAENTQRFFFGRSGEGDRQRQNNKETPYLCPTPCHGGDDICSGGVIASLTRGLIIGASALSICADKALVNL